MDTGQTKASSVKEYVELFWIDPVEALLSLFREAQSWHPNPSSLMRELVGIGRQSYAWEIPRKSLEFWIRASKNRNSPIGRLPNYENGVRVFRVLLEAKTRHERDLVESSF